MEYLITMTTHVPEGTSEETVDDIRSREAARASSRRKDACSVSGARRFSQASGARSGYSPPTTQASSGKSWP